VIRVNAGLSGALRTAPVDAAVADWKFHCARADGTA